MTTTLINPEVTDVRHDSVLMEECLAALEVSKGDVVVDATLGGAGHFTRMLGGLGPKGTLIGIDADDEAIARAKQVTTAHTGVEIHLVQDNFRNLSHILETLNVSTISKSLFDLGWSGFQLARGRGFSFKNDEPLYMTYGAPEAGITAEELVNEMSETELANTIFTLGEERFSRGIAASIVATRKTARITSTLQLVAAIEAGVPGFYKRGRLHPATKTFQALRIAVNDEYGAIREGIAAAIMHTCAEGRIAVITFHSSEDRLVKQLFRAAVDDGFGTLGTKKPIVPSRTEVLRNPRARSAKLRVFVRSEEKITN